MNSNDCTILNDTNINEVPISNDEYEKILDIQKEILELTSLETDTQIILNKLCAMAEALLPNSVSSLMIKDPITGLINVKAAPSVPAAGWEALDGIKPGPYAGSCANAVYHTKPQYIVNTFTDERGRDFLDTAKAFNLCSCWSTPVKNENNEAVGSFALSSFEHRSPAPFHKKLLETSAAIVNIVLKNEEHRQELYTIARNDALTNLKNKLQLQEDIQQDTYQTLIFLDINNFSYINTAYGFDIGDEILIEVANHLQNLFADNIYRINADQFALKFNDKIDIYQYVKKIRSHFSHNIINAHEVNLKVSFTYGGVFADKDLLKHAALSIKKAKESGKNRLHIFDASLDSSKKREMFIHMNSALYTAFDEDTIVPFFQGIYDNHTKQITKYEALIRIVTPEQKVIAPMEFLEVAKLSGLLPTLTKIMIDKTFKIMATNHFNFSINITEDDLSSHYLNEYLSLKALEYEIEPSRVTLEILEGVSATGQKNNIKQLLAFKKDGYKLAIDDFGAEYSNFERVIDLDVNILKIDARYIKNIDTNTKSYEIVKAITNFAKSMNIITIAEFVHSQSVQKIVQDLGIDYSQGYYFSEPTKTLKTEPLNS